MKTFWIRTLSATVYALLFIGCIYAGRLTGNFVLGIILFTLFLTFVSVVCAYEFYRMARKHRIKPLKWIGYVLTAVVTIALSLQPIQFIADHLDVFLHVVLLVSVPLCLICQLWRKSKRPISDIAYTLFPILYVAIPLGLMTTLNERWSMMMILLILVWVNDSFAYMGGSLLGRHKLFPKHSPGKTWEGTICGAVFTFVTALVVGPLFAADFFWYDWLSIAFICSVFGTLGDLGESMMKRSVGLKDSGKIMPGHGGLLDRFDSLLVIVPLVFLYLYFRTIL